MASLDLVTAQGTVSIPIKVSDAKLIAAMRRYAIYEGIFVDGMTNAQLAKAVLRNILLDLGNKAAQVQRAQELAAQQAALEATLTADNELFEEE